MNTGLPGRTVQPSPESRRSGVLLHITSLPAPFGTGDLGPSAHRFCLRLARSCQTKWQVLPIHPVYPDAGYSPYHCSSAFAGNPLLISPELLVTEGYIDASGIGEGQQDTENKASFGKALVFKEHLLHLAGERFLSEDHPDFEAFCSAQTPWLDDYALFSSLKRFFGGAPWTAWDPPIRDREPSAIRTARNDLSGDVLHEKFTQYVFFSQWERLRKTCRREGISLVGDIPLYVAGDSCDAWCNRHLFDLGPDGMPLTVSGVPPDYFSPTGQRWGTPVYRWKEMAEDGYRWWVRRIRHLSLLFDEIRIDHFRGIESYYTIPAGDETAAGGWWEPGPGAGLLMAISRAGIPSRLIAEDLGIITRPVRALMETFGLPGMRVLQFAFGEDMPKSPHIPHNHPVHCYVYTGTHDNNTARGWYDEEAGDTARKRLAEYIGRDVSGDTVHRDLIRLAMLSTASDVIIPFQDLAGLPGTARMNTPGTTSGNWLFRMEEDQFSDDLVTWLGELTRTYGRTGGCMAGRTGSQPRDAL